MHITFLHTSHTNAMQTTKIVNLKPNNVHGYNKVPKNARKVSFQEPKKKRKKKIGGGKSLNVRVILYRV